MKRGVPVPVPPASRSPRLAPAAAATAAAPAPCAPRLRDELPERVSAQAPERVFPTRKEATIEKRSKRKGTFVLTSAIVLGAVLSGARTMWVSPNSRGFRSGT